jgi:hypothetical protein
MRLKSGLFSVVGQFPITRLGLEVTTPALPTQSSVLPVGVRFTSAHHET